MTAGDDSKARTAVVIGAYGGEHVGDAAILGGVLHRIHEQHEIQHVCVLSTRPDRTRRWCEDLDVPVLVEVAAYEQPYVDRAIERTGWVVYGGGPVMDMPPLLLKHWDTVLRAKRAGARFVMEGVGVGPFHRRTGRWLADQLLARAEQITVRSERSAEMLGELRERASVAQDPAFDYLATRIQPDRLDPAERGDDRSRHPPGRGPHTDRRQCTADVGAICRRLGGAPEDAFKTLMDKLAEGLKAYAQRVPKIVRCDACCCR